MALPAQPRSAEFIHGSGGPSIPRPGQATTVLIVEDEAIVAMDLSQQLNELGYRVCTIADNGRDAIDFCRRDRPDVVLMDIVLKGPIDGIDAARTIGRTVGTPVIFLTAYSDASTVERAAQTAANGYLTKPFQIREVRAAIEVAIYKAAVERRLRESERWFSATLRCVADGIVATTPDARVRFMNPVAEALTGWTLDEANGRDIDEIMHIESPQSGQRLESPLRRAISENHAAGIHFGSLLVARGGSTAPIDDSAAPIRGDDEQLLGAVMAFRDVSERLRAEEALHNSEDRFRIAFDFAPVGMALVSLGGRLIQVNAAICKLVAYDSETLSGMDQTELTHPDDRASERISLYRLLAGDVNAVQFEKRLLRSDGVEVSVLVSASLLKRGNEPFCYLYQIHDLTERKAVESELARLAHFDTLTGLANRARLRLEIDRQVSAARRSGERFAVLFIDVDHFKKVNDSAGHEAGDRFLQLLAERLRGVVRDADCVARLGGDEFVILLPNLRGADGVVRVLDKLRARLAEPIRLPAFEVLATLSIGVSLFPDDGGDATTLFRNADSALYHAKAEGRNNTQFYRPELTIRLAHRLQLERELQAALPNGEFELHYQPVISLTDGRPIGAEALIRWNHPRRGLVSPDEFIPVAEDTGLIVAIGEWVLRTACATASRWTQNRDDFVIAVNLSARQFKTGTLVDQVADAMRLGGLPPGRLCLEITEQLLLTDAQQNIDAIDGLKRIGAQISVDDFGTGYSSLSYLRRFLPSSLKIDRSFVSNVVDNSEDATIVRTIVAMAHALKLRVVAEGVETEAQRQFLQRAGCDCAQGLLYSQPLPAERFTEWLQQAAD